MNSERCHVVYRYKSNNRSDHEYGILQEKEIFFESFEKALDFSKKIKYDGGGMTIIGVPCIQL